ncbi:hypothetical protein M501DRAFT_939347 [Patellaria atrata CBS 101060]|uniref:CAP-Gly domain-containing protein n=1 Tax=Patellaria atrata CBS 101060 TaxID=1346257 RepID=A0A9P4S5X6_9PEZI|nr:hypothetical protein M501DRAFT_939347 [Patellaria atrata CBS 101060]
MPPPPIEVGETVDVPGGMHGVVKFVGAVKGKKGVFAGVELAKEYAARGKNDGDVEGTRYFTTSVPGSGIFLPMHRASKRASPSRHTETFPPTPTTPSFSNYQGNGRGPQSDAYSPPTPVMPKFSQSVGPGARAPSPVFKPKQRPSLPRPESPFRRQPNLQPTPARGTSVSPASFSKSAIGAPRYTSTNTNKFSPNKPRTPGPPSRPYSRTGSRLGHHDAIEEDQETTPIGTARTSDSSYTPSTRSGYGGAEEEIQRLKNKLEERDKQLREQAATLTEMEKSFAELQTFLPTEDTEPGADAAQLRAVIREKNEKISMLTAEFDAHRQDFRSTLDTLEEASTETVRVYEKKVEDLTQQLQDAHEGRADVETVAKQLKQLEELVQELEEGLEDARRGEAEARGEVEFLRGEVERGRSELRREREKAAAALKGAGDAVDGTLSPGGSRAVEQRDDEIRGLKAIIHSLSSGSDIDGRSPARRSTFGVSPDNSEHDKFKAVIDRLEREKEELRGLVERKAYREEELEREVERMRQTGNGQVQRDSVLSNGAVSETTAMQDKRSSARDSKGTVVSWRGSPQVQRNEIAPLDPMLESDAQSSAEGSVLWCEICETGGHDILNCTNMGSQSDRGAVKTPDGQRNGKVIGLHGLRNLSISDIEPPAPLTPSKKPMASPSAAPSAPLPNPYDSALVAGKGSTVADPNKWCALCERDGHDATLCPFEDAF